MRIAAAALAQGDIDYVAGVGPASVAATLSGLQSRANRIHDGDRVGAVDRTGRFIDVEGARGVDEVLGAVRRGGNQDQQALA